MAVGIGVKDDYGGFAINEKLFTWGQSATGTITLVDDGMTHPQPMVTGVISVSGSFPVVAIRPRGNVAVGVDLVTGGGGYSYRLLAQSNTPVVVDWWAFDSAAQAMKDPTMQRVNLIVKDPFGAIVFDASMPHMRIIGTLNPGMSTAPIGADQSTYDAMSVPAGKSYAVIISTLAHIATMYDTGIYNSGNPALPPDVPETEPPEIVEGPPVGATWREMILETYLGMVRFDGATLSAGLTCFERFKGWYPIGQEPHLIKNGSPSFNVVDVTGYGGGTGGGGTTITVSLNNYTPSASGAAGADIISPAITASASGGTGPYTYSWVYDGGSNLIVAHTATNANPFQLRSPAQPAGTTRQAKWRVKATDDLGNTGWSDPLTFTATAGAGPDYTPDPITAFDKLTVSSNDPDVSWSAGVRKITGINQPITLRFERYGYTGNLSALHIDVFTSTVSAAGPWTHHGYFTASNGGTQYLDVTGVANDTWITYNAHAITNSGSRTGSCTLTIWNVSDPGGSVKISDVTGNSFTVDADNNYNVADVTPNPVSLSDQSVVTNDWEGYTPGTYFQITGINQPITIRVARGPTSDYENIFTRRLIIGHSTNGGASYTETNMGALSAPLDFTVNNGDWMFLKGYFNTNSLRGSASWTTTVTAVEASMTLGSITVSGTVDNDNNYNPPADFTPDSFNLGTMSLSTTANAGYSSTQVVQLTGFNQAISLKFTRDNLSITGNILYGRTYVGYASNPGGPWTDHLLTAAAGDSVTFTVSTGMYIRAYAYAETGSGAAHASWNCYVQNMSTGGTVLNTFYGNCYVDTDNNYNVAPPLAAEPSTSFLFNSQYTNSGINVSTSTNYGALELIITGGTPPYNITWQRWSGSWGSPWSLSSGGVYPVFTYYGLTNYDVWETVRAYVTDSAGGAVFSGWIDVNLKAGDTF